jgi:transcriptional regulator with XRE-family HTH domain
MSTWSDRIRRLEADGWTLAELAKAVGIAYSTLNDIKNGRTQEPKGMAAVRLYCLAPDTQDQEEPADAANAERAA